MPERSSYPHGSFCWVDLMAHDMSAAIEWYGGLFGWSCETQDTGGGPPYGMFMLDGHTVAGVGQMSDEMKGHGVPPVWNSYVSVDDAAAIEKRVVELGGSVTVPTMKVQEAGWLAFFSDPSGAAFSVWQPGKHCGATLFMDPGSLCWNELATRDVAGAQTFYADLFGWTYRSDQGEPVYHEICNGDDVTGGMIEMQWGEMPPYWMAYFAVEDVQASVDRVGSTGGRVIMPPRKIDGVGTFAVVQDPQGATFSLIRLDAPA